MEVPVVKNGEKKTRKDGNDRWDTLSNRELLQGKSCVTEMGGKLAGGDLGHVCIHYAGYCGKYVENCMQSSKNDCPSYDSPEKLLSAAWTLACFQRSCLHIIYKVLTCG